MWCCNYTDYCFNFCVETQKAGALYMLKYEQFFPFSLSSTLPNIRSQDGLYSEHDSLKPLEKAACHLMVFR